MSVAARCCRKGTEAYPMSAGGEEAFAAADSAAFSSTVNIRFSFNAVRQAGGDAHDQPFS